MEPGDVTRGRLYTYSEIAAAQCIHCGEPITLNIEAGQCWGDQREDGQPGHCVYLLITSAFPNAGL